MLKIECQLDEIRKAYHEFTVALLFCFCCSLFSALYFIFKLCISTCCRIFVISARTQIKNITEQSISAFRMLLMIFCCNAFSSVNVARHQHHKQIRFDYYKFGNFSENIIFVNRPILKNRDLDMIYLHQ